MLVDYKIADKFLPSEREVWLMSKRAERDGHDVSKAVLRAMESGEIKYINGVFYRLCRHCMDYLEVDSFYENKRYVLNINYICKDCTATRRRIKKYGVAQFLSDTGMNPISESLSTRLEDDTKYVLMKKIGGDNDNEYTQ